MGDPRSDGVNIGPMAHENLRDDQAFDFAACGREGRLAVAIIARLLPAMHKRPAHRRSVFA